MAKRDLTVRGAGIFGLSVAWEALLRGARVRVVDPAGPGAGASGGVVGALAPHVPENWNTKKQLQFESLAAAEAFWAGVEAASGLQSGYRRNGRLQPLGSGEDVARARARAEGARAHWGTRFAWEVVSAGQAGPFAPASPTGLLLRDTLSARLHPARATAALAAAIRSRGGEILSDAADEGAVVHATGWQGLEEISEAFGRNIGKGIRGQAALLGFDAGPAAPQVFAGGVHVVPHADGTVAVGSTTETEGAGRTGTDARLDAVIASAREAVPALLGAPVVARWAGTRPRARSRAPLLGPWPGRPGHVIANGGFKIGFGMAPGVARLIADLVLDGRDEIPDEFRLEANL